MAAGFSSSSISENWIKKEFEEKQNSCWWSTIQVKIQLRNAFESSTLNITDEVPMTLWKLYALQSVHLPQKQANSWAQAGQTKFGIAALRSQGFHCLAYNGGEGGRPHEASR